MDEWLDRYCPDPVLFVREVFGAEPEPFQREIMEAVARGDRRISVRSGHGVGKTTVLAWIIVHHILTKYPQKTICTAPTSAQLFDALASEVKAWISKLPPPIAGLLVVKSDRIELKADPNDSYISFRTSRAETPEAMAGVHSANVLLVADEASGIPEQVFEAGAGSMSGHKALTIMAGNPVRSSGLFYDSHNSLRDMWTTFHVSCEDSPRVTPDFISDIARRYGERSNAYRVRVLGEFPLADDDTIIPYEWAEASLTRDVEPMLVPEVWGLDCARFGDDRSTLARRRGNYVPAPVEKWYGLDTMQLVGRVKAKWDETPHDERPAEILVDVIGIGAGVTDRLRELGLPARGINVSESAAMKEKFRDLKTELWWSARQWFETKMCRIEGDAALVGELTSVRYDFTSSGKLFVESKKAMKKRGLPSPDVADAFVLTFAGTAATATHGATGSAQSWKQPIRRFIAGIV